MDRSRLLAHLVDLVSVTGPRPLRVGIDGVDASGKTTLADELAGEIGPGTVRSSIDSFNHPRSRRHRLGRLSPEGYYLDSHDHAAIVKDLLAPLGPGGVRKVRLASFDLAADSPVRDVRVDLPRNAVLILDGVFLLRPELAPFLDLVVFVHCTFDEVLARARVRDRSLFETLSELEEAYRRRYIAGQQIYLRECRPISRADVVIDNTDPADPRLIDDNDRAATEAAALDFTA